MTKKQNILLSHLINKYLSGYGNIQFIKSQRWIKFTRSHKGSDVYVEKSLFFFFILKYKLSRSTKFFGKCFQWKIHFLFPFIFTHFLNETSISYMSNPKNWKIFLWKIWKLEFSWRFWFIFPLVHIHEKIQY